MMRLETSSVMAIQWFVGAFLVAAALTVGIVVFLKQQATWRYPQQVDIIYILFGFGGIGVLCCISVGLFLLCKTGSCCTTIRQSYYAIPVFQV